MTARVSSGDCVLEAVGVGKTYPGTAALKGVDVHLRPGHVHALVGENGAGKSTLVKILAGVESPTSGRLLLDGVETTLRSARDAAARGIGIIHQELQLFPNLSIAENLFVGRERLTRTRTVDRAAQETLARDVLKRLGQSLNPKTLVESLPVGQQQLVEIARALVHNTRVLLMDEPTSALSATETHVLFQIVRDLAARGVSIVYISHRLRELLEVADSVIVLRDGLVVGEGQTADISLPWIVERMTGRSTARPAVVPAPQRGTEVLSVRGISLKPRAGRVPLENISFDVQAGEILGIYGLLGAGRTELFETLVGFHEDAHGEVRLGGRRVDSLDVAARVSEGIAMVPEDRQRSGLVQTLSVQDNMTLSSLSLFGAGWLSPSKERDSAQRLATELTVKAPSLTAPVTSLSGGNQQKVVIGRALMRRPRVLLMDEPTRGVDVGAKVEILQCMHRFADAGMAVIFASSELDEVMTAATRVIVMSRGRITGQYAAHEATQDALASAASAIPVAATRGIDARA